MTDGDHTITAADQAVIDQAVCTQAEHEGAAYARTARRPSRSAPVHFGPARRDAWLRGYDHTIAEIKATAEAAKQQAIGTLTRCLQALFPYADAGDDPDRGRADDQVKAYQALAFLAGTEK